MTTRQGGKVERRGFIQRLTALCVRYVERFMPDPYLFAVILTVIVVALVALLVRGATAGRHAQSLVRRSMGIAEHLHLRVPDGADSGDGLHAGRGARGETGHRPYREQAEEPGSGSPAVLRCQHRLFVC